MLLLASAVASAVEPAARVAPPELAKAPGEVVDLFAAAESKLIDVRIIPRDDKQARIFVTNKSGRALNVRLPETYAAVPVLSQILGLPNNGAQAGAAQAPQTFGGPINAGPQNNQQNAFPRGVFNIPPEQTRDIKVAAVCLDYGKPTPRALIPYELVPLASIATDPAIEPVLRAWGSGKYNRLVVQAAAWHLASSVSWEELAKKEGTMVAASEYEPYFTANQLKQAKALVAAAKKEVAQKESANSKKPTRSPGEKLKD
jgi:hypothetical protein